MYLVLFLVLGLAAFSQQHCRHHNHRPGRVGHLADYHSRLFEEVANDVIALDRKSQQFCEANSNGGTQEVLEQGRYVLKVTLQDFAEQDISVQIRHRVVYINAFKAESGKHYSEVRELPSFLNNQEAKFTFEDSTLEVVFPTKDTFRDSCVPQVNDEVITVPKFELLTGETSPRFGAD